MARKKPWERKNSSLEPKNVGAKEEGLRYLIFCEDTYGGTTYFREMKRERRSPNIHIELGGKHGEPYKLVQAARKRRSEAPRRRGDQGMEYHEVWCVIDIEAPRPHDSLEEAVLLARKSGIELAYANPCFEFWLFLHQKDHTTGPLSTADAIRKMKGLKCCYTASKDFDPRHFLGRPQQEAIRRAERLGKRYGDGVRLRDRNPGTDIHVLVRRLLAQT